MIGRLRNLARRWLHGERCRSGTTRAMDCSPGQGLTGMDRARRSVAAYLIQIERCAPRPARTSRVTYRDLARVTKSRCSNRWRSTALVTFAADRRMRGDEVLHTVRLSRRDAARVARQGAAPR
jgi:hypothetical protein